jgi:hypothetical protein
MCEGVRLKHRSLKKSSGNGAVTTSLLWVLAHSLAQKELAATEQ